MASATLSAALIYYLCYRCLQLPLTDLSAGSFPSFAFVFAFGVLAPRLPGRWQLPLRCHWLLLTLLCEPLFGTADALDVFAALVGHFAALAVSRQRPLQAVSASAQPWLFLTAPLLLVGSYMDWGPDGYGKTHEPVYLSYTELRQSVSAEAARPVQALGRLIVYQDHLFINDLNKGLHVIDNSDPAAPHAVGFITIPGNTDVSIRNGLLYADSFVDLVVVDIRDPANIGEISRQVDVFPWDKYQMVGDEHWFEADASLGVVVDLKEIEESPDE